MRKPSKWLTISLLIVIILTLLISVVYADSSKMLQAWYGVKIMYNNQQLVTNADPFIVDGTTYIPLRMIMNTFGKDITWDGTTETVNIFDKPSSTEIALRNQLAQKDVTIADLEAKLRKYDSGSSSSTSMSSLEDNLNSDYKNYNSKDFEISLSGDQDDVTVRIDVSSSDWNNLSTSNKNTLLQDISNDIRNKYDKAHISGYIRNSSSSSKMAYFYFTSGETICLNSDQNLIDLGKKLDEDYYDYFDSKDIPLYITVEGSDSSPEFYVNVNYHKYESEWDGLSTSQVITLMSKIFSDVKDELNVDNTDIEGYVYDTYSDDNIGNYTKSSGGTENFNKNW